MLIINADDWGRDRETTDRTLDCVLRGSVSSVSAMVFMEDSERAAELSRKHGVDAGLHLNLTTPFTAPNTPSPLAERQRAIASYLRATPISRMVFHPGLTKSFEYVVAAQKDEFLRLYGAVPARIDGHHHMHLAANVLLGGLLPRGSLLRRHFSYEAGEKAIRNGIFRLFTDFVLRRRYRTVDDFFSLPPIEKDRLHEIFSRARQRRVEVETHPVDQAEYKFLTEGEIFRWTADCTIARGYSA